MTRPNRPRYACRLNAFRGADGLPGMIARAAGVAGIDAADLNYPDHFAGQSPAEVAALLGRHGLALNPDPAVRRTAIDLTRRGLDALAEAGGRLMTLWLGQDGIDYPFQGNYARMWDDTVSALAELAAHDPRLDIALEYKPSDPRAFALMPDVGTTLLAIREAGAPNLGVTLDFAHVLCAGEMPAHAAHLAARHSRLLGVHLNDGYGQRDDGLIAGSIHPVQTVELFVELARIGYDGVIYFDTFPDLGGLDPAAEACASVALVERLWVIAADLAADAGLAAAIARQDAAASMRIVAARLYGAAS